MDTNAKSKGIGFLGLLQLIFIVLKLVKAISWSWFWVLSPMIFGFGGIFVIIVGAGIVGGIWQICKGT